MAQSVVLSLRPIAAHYLRGWFVLDVLSTFPFDLLLAARQGAAGGAAEGAGGDGAARLNRVLRAIRVVKLVRLLRASRALKGLEAHLTMTDPAVLRLGRLVMLLLFMWHWLGCVWSAARARRARARCAVWALVLRAPARALTARYASHRHRALSAPRYAVRFFKADVSEGGVPLLMADDAFGRPRDLEAMSRVALFLDQVRAWGAGAPTPSRPAPRGWPGARHACTRAPVCA